MSKTVITIEHLRGGQPRPYADSVYEAKITAERHGVFTNGRVIPYYLTEAEVKKLTRMFVHGFSDNPEWDQSRLKYLLPVKPKVISGKPQSGAWKVSIVQPYLG